MSNKKSVKKVEITERDARFESVKFAGTFREYQQRVIENSCKYLQKNNKLHIVAAPGSGKTILGLELIRMLGRPALILSPTIAIREQWKERFNDMFLVEGQNVDNFVSCSLVKPSLLTSITYQGLYTSYRKLSNVPKSEEGEDGDDGMQAENYSVLNIIQLMEEHKISVICLDEAHHLRAEWQKALYEFVAQVEHNVTVIALTATPPYDSKKSEWDKYIAMCGPIDEEIFVPELIRAKTLCAHQDYIYYNFPTDEEAKAIEKYQKNVDTAVKEVFAEGKFLEIILNSEFYKDPLEFCGELEDRPDFVKAVLAFLEASNVKPPKLFVKTLEKDDRKIVWDLAVAQNLFQCMISDDQLFGNKEREFVKAFLSKHGLVEKNQVGLITNGDLEKLLFTSIGKLNSIGAIVDEEWKNLGENIRLLVLTDFIRANSKVLGSDEKIKEMGVVPIFELLRRRNKSLKLAAISGKIVIVPNIALGGINEIAARDNTRMRAVAIAGTEHSELKFEGANSAQKISVITKAFNEGIINGIVGTKSLLGEGWDSPVINTLILASCVGSFMLSNQMRGRAIRIDRNKPEKVSNIWHLTAILPEHLLPDVKEGLPPSADYATLERRFHGFMGLCYHNDVIESSLQRAKTLVAPYDENGINKANGKTFELVKDREATCTRWRQALAKASNEVLIQNEIPKPKKGFIPAVIMRPTHFATVRKVTHATIKTFKELDLINKKARAVIEKNFANKTVDVGIARCSKYEKSIFHQAMSEVLGPFDSPKYILVKTNKNGKQDPRASFAVPEVFAKKKETAEVFKLRMSKRITNFEVCFTRSADGKKTLAAAKKRAYVNKQDNEIQSKMKLKSK
jgi:superfamily II DNA or RNA helicase